MKYLRTAGTTVLLGALLAASAARASETKAAPELPLAGTTAGPLYLEDLRGLVTVFCFYDDSGS